MNTSGEVLFVATPRKILSVYLSIEFAQSVMMLQKTN